MGSRSMHYAMNRVHRGTGITAVLYSSGRTLVRRKRLACGIGLFAFYVLVVYIGSRECELTATAACKSRLHFLVPETRELGSAWIVADRNSKETEIKNLSKRFEERRRHVKEICRTLNFSKQPGVRNAWNRFVFPTNTSPVALFCPVPKTGTTFLKKLFGTINERKDFVMWAERFNVRPVDNYDQAVMFFFTRDPYSRMFSSYVDKLWSPNLQFWGGLGREVKEVVRLNISRKSIDCGHDVTFPEVIRYVITGLEKGVRINTHFMPTNTFCEACDYDYDYIGQLETFREDAGYILNVLNITTTSLNNDNDTLKAYIRQAYYTLSHDKKQCASKAEVLRRTWRALQLRGLISMEVSFPKQNTEMLTKEIFSNLVQQAAAQSVAIFDSRDQQFSHSERQLSSRDEEVVFNSRDIQRSMALSSAYSLVPLEDRKRVSELLRSEFELFGYPSRPDHIFAPSNVNTNLFDLEAV